MNLTTNLIETSVKYDKVMEDGMTKSVTEKFANGHEKNV